MSKINRQAVFHISDIPFAYPLDKDTLKIKLRAASGDFEKVELLCKDRYDFQNEYNVYLMDKEVETELFDFYSVNVSIFRNRYRYIFRLTDNSGKVWYFNERGIHKDRPKYAEITSFQFPYIGEADVYQEKKFLSEAVVYQIFPERFSNGDTSNDPENTEEWGSLPTQRNSFGGDLRGIINNLEYLKDLGVNLIYLTPIFESSTNHKYNTKDYYKIDPQFGTLDDAKELVDKVHELGMKIVFDAVFNHSGSDFFAFRDVIEKGESSEYVEWYHIDSLPVNLKDVNYYTFANKIANMPKFRTENENVRKYLFDVGRYWVEEIGIDGWRLDVCDEVDHKFWRDFKSYLQEVKKDVILVGEIMHESSSFLRGDQLDSIMNYPFKNAMVDFFGKSIIDESEFIDILSSNINLYMESVDRQLWNLLDSHDTPRFLTEAEGDIRRLKVASFFQFTYIGVPYIYYGDEIGLEGGHDPLCRGCMLFDEEKQNLELKTHFKEMIKLRRENPELIYGNFRVLKASKNTIVYTRELDGVSLVMAVNNTDKERKIKFEHKGIKKEVKLPAFGFSFERII